MSVFKRLRQGILTSLYVALGLLALETLVPQKAAAEADSLEGTVLAISQQNPQGIPVFPGNVVADGENGGNPFQRSTPLDMEGNYCLVINENTAVQNTSWGAIKALYGPSSQGQRNHAPPQKCSEPNNDKTATDVRVRIFSPMTCSVVDTIPRVSGEMQRDYVLLAREGWNPNGHPYTIIDAHWLGEGKWVNHPEGDPMAAIFLPEITDSPLKVYLERDQSQPDPWNQYNYNKTLRTWMFEKLDLYTGMGYEFEEVPFASQANIIYRMSPEHGARIVDIDSADIENLDVRIIEQMTVEVWQDWPYEPFHLARTLFKDASGYGNFDYGYDMPGIFTNTGGYAQDPDIVSFNAMLEAAKLKLVGSMDNDPESWH